MDIHSVCIFGGTGFVGRSIAEQAVASGLHVRVVTRTALNAKPLLVLPTLDVEVADPNDEKSLARCLKDMDAAINLVGILHEGGGATFEAVHAGLPRRIVRACRTAGVKRLVHMSSLGASASGPSAYQRSKAAGEAAVREPDAPAHTIFRPSVIFGEQDSFLNLFASLIRLAPVLPLASPRARFQPVWVEDVARCFVAALGDARTHGQVYELGGPRVTTLEELVAFVGATLGRRPAIVPLPASLAYLQALVLEYLPGHVMTRDNLRSMSVDNVCAGPFPSVFGFEPTPMEAVVPGYLAAAEINSRYQRFRNLAGR